MHLRNKRRERGLIKRRHTESSNKNTTNVVKEVRTRNKDRGQHLERNAIQIEEEVEDGRKDVV